MSHRVALSFCLIVSFTSFARSAPLDNDQLDLALDNLIESHPTFQRTTVCLKVVDLESGAVLYDRLGDRLMTPASNLKIYTSACALDVFGPDKRFVTQAEAMGRITDGVLEGNLLLVGGGDAMLSSDDLRDLTTRVVNEWGIHKIKGTVQVDNSRYGSPLKGPGWMWDDDPDYYNMSVTPLVLDFNVMRIELSENSNGLLSAKLVPATDYPTIKYVAPESLPGKRLFWRAPFTEPILVAERGNLDEGGDDKDLRITPHDPGKWVAGVFEQMFRERGVTFSTGEAPEQRTSQRSGPTKQLSFEGKTLSATLKQFDHESENAVGEVLLHEIAIARGFSRPTWSDGAKAITQWLVEVAGLDPKSFRLVDGSGLSRYNLISADSSVVLLARMHKHKYFSTFFDALPEYKVELKDIDWPGEPATEVDSDRVRAKSGGMTGVSTISGYLRTLDGRLLAFSLLANGFVGSNEPVLDLREQVWQTLVQYRRD
jgi:serine-type D-Ala-D-Ala carboxypeptidase/endopeptidase (penicillin-binding protein 4)